MFTNIVRGGGWGGGSCKANMPKAENIYFSQWYKLIQKKKKKAVAPPTLTEKWKIRKEAERRKFYIIRHNILYSSFIKTVRPPLVGDRL